MMATSPYGAAERSLNEQIDIVGAGRISLDSLWRASGCPIGREPHAWVARAKPLLDGFAAYYAGLDAQAGPLLWTWDAERSEPWQPGDLMADALIARVYAAFLDGRPA